MPRTRAWADSVHCASVMTDEQDNVIDLLAGAPTSDTLTVARIVLDLSFAHLVAGAVDAENCVSMGIGVTSAQAFAAVPPAVPDPASADEYPPRGWLYVANMAVRTYVATSGGAVNSLPAVFHVDLRAMRKVDKGILFLAIGNNATTGAQSVTFTGRVRTLCLT